MILRSQPAWVEALKEFGFSMTVGAMRQPRPERGIQLYFRG